VTRVAVGRVDFGVYATHCHERFKHEEIVPWAERRPKFGQVLLEANCSAQQLCAHDLCNLKLPRLKRFSDLVTRNRQKESTRMLRSVSQYGPTPQQEQILTISSFLDINSRRCLWLQCDTGLIYDKSEKSDVKVVCKAADGSEGKRGRRLEMIGGGSSRSEATMIGWGTGGSSSIDLRLTPSQPNQRSRNCAPLALEASHSATRCAVRGRAT
jgi:hypothetical protein